MKENIRRLLNKDWQVHLQHVYGEGNRCADCLANIAFTHDVGILHHDQPPSGCLQVLLDNIAGVALPRYCIM